MSSVVSVTPGQSWLSCYAQAVKTAFAETDVVRGKQGYSRGIHIWEIRWRKEHRGSHAVIGVASYQAPLQCSGECK